MFRPAKIFHTKSFVPKEKVKELILELHEKGICEIKEADEKIDKLTLSEEETLSLKEVEEIGQKLNSLLVAVEPFREVVAPENVLKKTFFPAPPEKIKVDLLSNEKVFSQVKTKLSEIEPLIYKKLELLDETQVQIQKNSLTLQNLLLLPKKVNLQSLQSTENVYITLGLILNSAIIKLKEKIGNQAFILIEKQDEKTSLVIVLGYAKDEAEIEKTLHEIGYEKIIFPFEKNVPQKVYSNIREKNIALNKKIIEIKETLSMTVKKHAVTLDLLKEELEVVRERIMAHDSLRASDSFAVLESWVPEKNLRSFDDALKKTCSSYYTESIERDDAPTIYNNHKIIAPFEIITSMYSIPKYKEIDPTPIVAISFALFFGFMLTDFVYGVLTVGIAYMMYRGIGRYNPGIKKFSSLLLILGVSTAVLGIIFKSYLGNFVPDILEGMGIGVPGIDPIRQVFLAILIAIGIGAVHLFIGLLTGYIENTRSGNIKKAIGEQGVWILLLVGGIMAIVGGEGFVPIALGLIGLSVVIQLVYNYMENGAVISILSIFNFSGFLGDLFSYARLTALAVGTAGIALAVNFMAFLAIDMIPILGIPIAILVFVVGHLFNMVMNGLGAFIHSLRLHFLEFFSKFYEGGGRLYKPFYAYRKKTEV